MRVLLSTFGSRGDVQPVLALAVELRAFGVDARVSAPADEEFQQLFADAHVPLLPAFAAARTWLAEVMPQRKRLSLPDLAAKVMMSQYAAVDAAVDAFGAPGCDAMLTTGLFSSVIAAHAVAEKRNLRYVHAAYCPFYLPSPHHRPLEYPGYPHPLGVTDNQVLWNLNSQVMDEIFGTSLNKLRASIGLAPLDNVRDHVFTERPLLAADPVLAPWRQPSTLDVVQTGAWILRDERPLGAELEAFLDAGEPPVYVGFGSLTAPNDFARIAIEAVRAQGRRVLMLRGWAELGLVDAQDDCFLIGEVNQQALFPRVAAVVHHGGAGTTTAAACAGVPQVIVPQMGDQPYWAERVQMLGIGVAHAGAAPTVGSLAAVLESALSSGTRTQAAAIARTMCRKGALRAARLLKELA
jgi:vancomycin aglycone glucosyltransferase